MPCLNNMQKHGLSQRDSQYAFSLPRITELFFNKIYRLPSLKDCYGYNLFLFQRKKKITINYSQLKAHHPSTQAKISGATMVASLSTMYLGVLISSLPQVIFS